ncbi:hypothetical protein MMC25_002781 [Agyrium rufum]|nr:hypothetical protein [Agyrium rufum]
MAQQNINDILARLGGQHPGGPPMPPQMPPHQMPQGYPPPQQHYGAPPPGHGPAYGLPQPSSAGQLDLSGIRPSNAGSVSLADAMTRARGFAAEKGLAYDASRDPRYSPRPLQRRSRSRSPQRMARDSFRDNYNPYRDERREDPRRAMVPGPGYPRERSFSPNRGMPLGAYAPPVYGKPPGGADEGVEIIYIDSNLVGLIIGRSGENLRRVEAETSTRVQFLTGAESSGPKRQCKITGSRAARDHAKAEIDRIIEENGNPARGNVPPDRMASQSRSAHQPTLRDGEDATQIMVPNRTVGLIIGRGGETIRDLQEKSQCHVNIVGPDKAINGLRPINLIGTPQAASMAKELILEIVESDTKNGGQAQGGPPQRDQGRNEYGGDSERITDTLVVPSEAVGMIIGKGGETIKDMQSTTGCKINVSQPSGQDLERSIGLVGSRSAIEAAKRAIMEKVHAVEEKNRGGGGGGGGRQYEQFNDRYSQPGPSYEQHQPPPSGGGYSQQPSSHPASAPAAGDPDPYAPYGGYQNYVALWYASFQQGSQPPGGQQGPPMPGQPGSS